MVFVPDYPLLFIMSGLLHNFLIVLLLLLRATFNKHFLMYVILSSMDLYPVNCYKFKKGSQHIFCPPLLPFFFWYLLFCFLFLWVMSLFWVQIYPPRLFMSHCFGLKTSILVSWSVLSWTFSIFYLRSLSSFIYSFENTLYIFWFLWVICLPSFYDHFFSSLSICIST